MISIFNHTRLAAAAATAVILAGGATVGAIGSKPSSTSFDLFPNRAVQNCLAAPGQTPSATVEVKRGEDNDRLKLRVKNLKPDLNFDVFTVEKTPQLADGTANPNFGGNFGTAWYQSDLQTNHHGEGEITIKTVLLDQIFGFDASRGVAPREHLQPRVLVQQCGRCCGLRNHRDDPVQRRAPSRPVGDDHPPRCHHQARAVVHRSRVEQRRDVPLQPMT